MESLIDELHRQLDRIIRTAQTIAAVAVRGWDEPRFDNKIKRYTSTVESVQVIIMIIIIIMMMMMIMIMIMMMIVMMMRMRMRMRMRMMMMMMMIMIMVIVSEDMSINNEWMKQTTRNTK